MSLKNADKRIRVLIYALFLVTAVYLFYQLPYCHDDWHWGLSDRIALMKRWFQNYNGRYLGNLLILLLTRSTWAKMAVPALCLFWLLFELEKGLIVGEKTAGGVRILLLLVAVFLMSVLPQSLYMQTYGWLSGFANYVPPAVLFLAWYNRTADLYGDRQQERRRFGLLMLPLGFATQLFSENITIFAVAYAIWILALIKIRKRKIRSEHLLYLVGTVGGAALMFSNAGYTNTSSFKSISLSFSAMYYQLRDSIIDHLFLNNYLLNVVLALALLWLLLYKGRRTLVDTATALVIFGYVVYGIWHSIYPNWQLLTDAGKNNLLEMLFAGAWFLSVLLCLWRNLEKTEWVGIWMPYLCAAACAAPLMAASPIGARCFYISYILQCVTALKLLGLLLQKQCLRLWYPVLFAAVTVSVTAMAYLYAATENGKAERKRVALMAEAAESGAEEVTLPGIPYPGLCYKTVPDNESWETYFKRFYGLDTDVQLIFE